VSNRHPTVGADRRISTGYADGRAQRAGFVALTISPTELSNLTGEAGTSVAVGQAVQVFGVVTALIAGVLATRNNYRARRTATR
jgi:hypothetical protein